MDDRVTIKRHTQPGGETVCSVMVNTLAIRGLVEVVDSVRANGEDLHVYALTPAAMQALLDMSEGGEEA